MRRELLNLSTSRWKKGKGLPSRYTETPLCAPLARRWPPPAQTSSTAADAAADDARSTALEHRNRGREKEGNVLSRAEAGSKDLAKEVYLCVEMNRGCRI